jgi:ABC-type lipoprotein release transport system permease subunit
MEAIGVRPWQIVQFIYAETMIHTLLASVIGLIVGGAISWYLQLYGIDMSSIAEGTSFAGIALDPIWYAQPSTRTLATPVIFLFVIAAGANIGVGHITFIAPDYNRAPSSKKYLKQATELKHQIMQRHDVNLVVARIQSQAMFASARNSVGGMFIAIDPEQENTNNNLFLKAMIARGMLNDDSSSLLALYASHSLSDDSEAGTGA